MNGWPAGLRREGGRWTRRRLLRLGASSAAGLSLAPLLAGCTVADSQAHVVEMTDLQRFSPGSLSVARGATVVWHNTGTEPHTTSCNPATAASATDVQLPNGAAPWDSVDIYPGESWSWTFHTPGDYAYVCRYHEEDGMIGRITVLG